MQNFCEEINECKCLTRFLQGLHFLNNGTLNVSDHFYASLYVSVDDKGFIKCGDITQTVPPQWFLITCPYGATGNQVVYEGPGTVICELEVYGEGKE